MKKLAPPPNPLSMKWRGGMFADGIYAVPTPHRIGRRGEALPRPVADIEAGDGGLS